MTSPANPSNSMPPKGRAPISRGKLVAGGLVLLFVGYVVWQLPTWNALADTGAAYGARIGCSCAFVQGRDAGLCEADFEPGMEMVSLSIDSEEKTATASVPLLASRTARYAGATGCLLDSD